MLDKLAMGATIGAGLAIGLLWPSGHGAGSSPSAASNSDVVIARSGDHHYYADATVNGAPVRFMIDTGASETALTETDARQIGIAVDPADYEVVGDGPSGIVRGQYVQLKSIDLGGFRQRDVKALVMQGAPVSLLGQPFLENVEQIVIRNGEMRLSASSG
jgi:aspartyl protease family protein